MNLWEKEDYKALKQVSCISKKYYCFLQCMFFQESCDWYVPELETTAMLLFIIHSTNTYKMTMRKDLKKKSTFCP